MYFFFGKGEDSPTHNTYIQCWLAYVHIRKISFIWDQQMPATEKDYDNDFNNS
jgi:hypothetical protein